MSMAYVSTLLTMDPDVLVETRILSCQETHCLGEGMAAHHLYAGFLCRSAD